MNELTRLETNAPRIAVTNHTPYLSTIEDVTPDNFGNTILPAEKGNGWEINETVFADKFASHVKLYAHNSLGGQWLYNEDSHKWVNMNSANKEFATDVYQQLIKPIFKEQLEWDSNSKLAKALREASKEIAANARNYGMGTRLGSNPKDGLALFSDGQVFDLDTGETRYATCEDYLTTNLPYPMVTSEDGGSIREWLDFVLEDSAQAFYEYVGSAFFPRPIYNVFAFCINGINDDSLENNGGNGKSEVLGFIRKNIFDNSTATNLPIEDLLKAEDKKIINLRGSLINIDAESSAKFIDDTTKLKSLTGTGAKTIDVKYKDSVTMENTAKLIFGTNSIPQFRDDSSAFQRRLMIIPFNRDFKGKDEKAGKEWYAKELVSLRLTETERAKFAYFCMIQFYNLYKQKGMTAKNPFSVSVLAEELQAKTVEDNKPAHQFVKECPYLEFSENRDDMVHQGLVYNLYKVYAKNEGRGTIAKGAFKKHLGDHLANGDKPVNDPTGKYMFGKKTARAYCGIKLVKPEEFLASEDGEYKDIIIDHYRETEFTNIFADLPIK